MNPPHTAMPHDRALLERIKFSPLGRLATLPLRLRSSVPPWWHQTVLTLGWTLRSREWTNFSTQYSDDGVLIMVTAIAQLTGRSPAQVRAYAAELAADQVFADRVRQRKAQTSLRYITDPGVPLGKCLFNYVLVRAGGARQVFEAGTEQGLSSWAICRALQRNAHDSGRPLAEHRLVTIDLHTDRGLYLVDDEGGLVERRFGDSVASLRSQTMPLDLVIHDTINDDEHTTAQLDAAAARLSTGGLIHSSWFNQIFASSCERHGLVYLPVAERIQSHWFEGRVAGIARKP